MNKNHCISKTIADLNFALHEWLSFARDVNVNAPKFRFEKEATEAVFAYEPLFTEIGRMQKIAKLNINFLRSEEYKTITKIVF